jgi:hypothetical protein
MKLRNFYVGFEVLIAVIMKCYIYWVIISCCSAKVHRYFEGTCCPHLQGQGINQARNQHEAGSKDNQNSSIGCCVVKDMLRTSLWLSECCSQDPTLAAWLWDVLYSGKRKRKLSKLTSTKDQYFSQGKEDHFYIKNPNQVLHYLHAIKSPFMCP